MNSPTSAASIALAQLGEAVLDARAEHEPFLGTLLGVDGAPADKLKDLSAEGEAAARDRFARLLGQVEGLETAGLSPTERTSHDLLKVILRDEIESLELRTVEMTVDAFAGGPQAQLLMALPSTAIGTPQAAHTYLARLRGVPAYLQAATQRVRYGATHGRSATRLGVEGAIGQARSIAGAALQGHIFLLPLARARAAGVDLPAGLDEQFNALITDSIAPAMTAYAEALEADVLPHARGDEQVGLCHLADGADLYRSFLRTYTSVDLPPEQIHQIGLQVIAGLDEEYAQLGQKLFGTSDRAEIFSRLRDDASLRFDDPAELVAVTEASIERARHEIVPWFEQLPKKPCNVSPMPAATAAGMTAAYYQPPQGKDGPHGTYWINTSDPVLTRYEAECVAFHEAIPGHHTQIALQAELDLPRFRRSGLLLAGYAEGWALYVERLSDEMGLYSSDLARMGMLTADSMRACRLVIDTGLHHYGWSRDQALNYMKANAPISEAFARAEIDRYCVLPGQACSYMLGRHEIVRLRKLATEALGPSFDLKAFHHAVLSEGQVPLSTLAGNIERWIEGQQG